MKKKAILLAAISVMLVAAVTTGLMLAYFTDTETATNTFTIGNVDIKLSEPNWSENDAKLVPGRVIPKDPTVTVMARSEKCYVRMLVTINKSAEWDALGPIDMNEAFNINANWDYVDNVEDADKNTRTYEFRYLKAVETSATDDTILPALFTEVTVPTDLSGAEIKTLEGFEIVVVANAIQAETFDNADLAWAAFS